MDFESILKILVVVGAAVVIPVAAYAAIAATRAIWIKGLPQPESAGSEPRLAELEARLAELEERVDFNERMLAQAKSEGALPLGRP